MKNQNQALETVMVELERSLALLEANYRNTVSNLGWIRQQIETDELTQLMRRGAFMDRLSHMLKQAQTIGREYHLMMIDIDHFKKVNDTHGHQTGDVVLKRVSELVRNYLRPQDLAGRYGGEEIIVAVEADSREAMAIADKIRIAVGSSTTPSVSADAEVNVTLSVGVASTQEFGFEADVLIGKADDALYAAKDSGRNKVLQASSPAAKQVSPPARKGQPIPPMNPAVVPASRRAV